MESDPAGTAGKVGVAHLVITGRPWFSTADRSPLLCSSLLSQERLAEQHSSVVGRWLEDTAVSHSNLNDMLAVFSVS